MWEDGFIEVSVTTKPGKGNKPVPNRFMLFGAVYPIDRIRRKRRYSPSETGGQSYQYEIVSNGREYLLRCENADEDIWSVRQGSYVAPARAKTETDVDYEDRLLAVKEIQNQK